MGDLLELGAALLDDQRHRHMSRAVVYRRGAEEKEVQATIGRTEFEQADEAGLIHRTESRDYLIRAADLDLGAGPIQPRAGDQVREQAGSQVLVYEVNAPGSEPPWRYSDPYRRVMRVHTKLVGTEA
jgi:hypothetical protein